MKIIFLDIDGVLNNDKFLKRLRHSTHIDYTTDKVSYGSAMIDKYAVKRLQQIVSATDAKIVISSSWREIFSIHEIIEMLDGKLRNLGIEPALDFAGTTQINSTTRRNQIGSWLNDADGVEAFIILEDCEKMYELEKNTIRTSAKTGLTDLDVERAIKLLSTDTQRINTYG